jgi:hypothetical protein
MDLRASCDVGGRPGSLFVSPDGAQLFVVDRGSAQVSVVSVSRWEQLERIDLARPGSPALTFLGAFGDSMFLAGLPGKVDVFSAASRRSSGAIPCSGGACDLGILPELGQAVLTTVSGKAGFIELAGLAPGRSLGRMELPLPPARETLALLPKRGLGAVVLRGSTSGEDMIALFECRAGSEATFLRMEGSVRSLAFESEGRFLYAASRDESMLEVIDLQEQRVVERVLLAGEPFGVVADPVGKRVWALCEKLGHVAFIDPIDHSVFRRAHLPGLACGGPRVAFSPEGRLGVLFEAGESSLSLIEAGGMADGDYGEVDDRLELGRDVADIVWSPLGEELYVSSPSSGALLRLAVDRGDQLMKDTDLYLMDQLLRREDPAGLKNPLFPP